jgi:hypothetical protein
MTGKTTKSKAMVPDATLGVPGNSSSRYHVYPSGQHSRSSPASLSFSASLVLITNILSQDPGTHHVRLSPNSGLRQKKTMEWPLGIRLSIQNRTVPMT